MRTNHKPNKSFINKIIIIVVIILFACSVLFVLEKLQIINLINSSNPNTKNSSQKIDYNPPTQEQINANNNVDTKPDQKTTTNDPLIDTTSDNITLSTKRENDGNLTILTQLTDYSDGTCSLLIESGADKYTTSAPVIYQPTYSTCEGFNVSPTVVPSGVWKITLSVTSKGITNKQTTSVEVQ